MPLDPQVQAFLDQLSAARAHPPHELPLAEARRQMEASAVVLGPAPEIASVEDRRIPGPGAEIPIRIYRDSSARPAPGVVYFHGGGWVLGSINSHDKLCRELAREAGAVVVSVDYRLAPEHKYPAAAEDAYAATCWVAEHAAELGIDPGRRVVAGDSAGGNLAAAACLMIRDRGGPPPALQVLVYPITDFNLDTPSYLENAEGYFLTRDSMAWFWRQYLNSPADGEVAYVSPLRAADLSSLPSALVLTARYDPLRDEGRAYAERLFQAGVAVELVEYEGLIHGFLRRTDAFDKAKDALRRIAKAIKTSP
jgi:acetyl esterase